MDRNNHIKNIEYENDYLNNCYRCFKKIKIGDEEYKGNWGTFYCKKCNTKIDKQIGKKIIKRKSFVLFV